MIKSSTINILVVDDDEDDLYLINEAIEEVRGASYRVVSAMSPLAAMGELSKGTFDVILSDYRLGPITGIDFITSIRKAGIDTPVILLTGMPDAVVDAAALKAGASDFVPKISINCDVIDRTIRYALAHAERQRLLQAVLRSTNSGVAVLDKDGSLSLWNPRFEEFAIDAHGDANDKLDKLVKFAFASNQKDVNIGSRVVESHTDELKGGGHILVLHDVTQRVQDLRQREVAEQKIRKVAMEDVLTGLPNRMAFNDALDASINAAREGQYNLAIVGFDFNRFKEVNDLFGHAAGDALLKTTAARLRDVLQPSEHCARLGGDEFVLVQSNASIESAADLARRVKDSLMMPLEFEGKMIEPGISLGIAFYPEHGLERQQLLANADLAMYRAKAEGGGGVCVFGASIDQFVRDRRKIAHDLKGAIQNNELELYFQPQFVGDTGMLSGVEALLRWKCPVRGFVSPAEFIPIAEEIGLIQEIDDWVLRNACQYAVENPNVKRMAVNMSAKAIGRSSIAATVRQVLTDVGLSPSRLELEVTETAFILDLNRALHSLRQIKSLGISIAMDDFGTGYSSLSLLNSFPFDRIKIDKSFIQDAGNNSRAGAIFKSVVGLGKALQVPLVVEGVETAEQMRFSIEAGCEEIQGYHLSRPIPAAVLRAKTAGQKRDLWVADFAPVQQAQATKMSA